MHEFTQKRTAVAGAYPLSISLTLLGRCKVNVGLEHINLKIITVVAYQLLCLPNFFSERHFQLFYGCHYVHGWIDLDTDTFLLENLDVYNLHRFKGVLKGKIGHCRIKNFKN